MNKLKNKELFYIMLCVWSTNISIIPIVELHIGKSTWLVKSIPTIFGASQPEKYNKQIGIDNCRARPTELGR